MPASPSARKLPCRSAILDGEVIVQDALGVSDFEALQAALRSQPAQLIFYAFDLLHLDGKDLREKPLIERRTKLKRLIEKDPDNRIQLSEEFIGDAAAFFQRPAFDSNRLWPPPPKRRRGTAIALSAI